MLYYKIDVLEELKRAGWNPQKLRDDAKIGQSGLTKLRRGEMVSTGIIETICSLTKKQPGYFIGWKPGKPEASSAGTDPDKTPPAATMSNKTSQDAGTDPGETQ